MQVTLTWQSVITAGAVIAAVIALTAYFAKAVRWVDKQKKQDDEIRAVKEEQQIIIYGVLACLKGLHEQGANGPVTDAINRIEKHLNQAAHA
ncbi:MAG: branched-chain amino acid ABC transporter permease [Oscillospiraceae bacterium]|nr:branched-chain amino acid ABC transporter permease [Oscillospiraceae bacterium]